jgi:hypothetical protein
MSATIPKAWCPFCLKSLTPRDVLSGMCPWCSRILDKLIVDRETAGAIAEGRA